MALTPTVFINTKKDMRWLRDVHLPKLSAKYHSAVIYGNEDWPSLIVVYEKRNPDYNDNKFVMYIPDIYKDGEYTITNLLF